MIIFLTANISQCFRLRAKLKRPEQNPQGRADRWSLLGKDESVCVFSFLVCLCQCSHPSSGGFFLRVLLTPVGEISHSKAPLIKVHEYTGDFILRDRRLSTRARVCVCLIVLHPTVLLDESVNHFFHGQIRDQLILSQWAAGYWVEMTNTLQRERESIKDHFKSKSKSVRYDKR